MCTIYLVCSEWGALSVGYPLEDSGEETCNLHMNGSPRGHFRIFSPFSELHFDRSDAISTDPRRTFRDSE